MSARAVVVGLVIGVVLGGAIASLVWALVADSGGNDDVVAVCGIVERTPVPTEDTSTEDLRRWAVAEVLPSVVADNAKYKPLADTLEKAMRYMQQFQLDKMADAIDEAKRLCADV